MNLPIATTALASFGSPPIRTHSLDQGILEETTRFDNELGQGYYHDIYLADIHIGYGDLRPTRSLRLTSHLAAPVIELHCLLEGQCVSRLDSLGQELVFHGGESNLLFLPSQSGHHDVAAEQPCREFEIHLSGAFFQRLAQGGHGPLAGLLQGMQQRIPALLRPQHLPISPAMRDVIQQIMECPLHGIARRFLLEAKAVELLALQLAQTTTAAPQGPQDLRLRRPDMEKLHAARELLTQNLAQPPTLTQLAGLCGLNEFKLKKGFKQVFGDTVYGYLLNCKLELAHRYLQEGEMTISEVAEQVGYRHASHFTAAFKKKYSMLPKEVRS